MNPATAAVGRNFSDTTNAGQATINNRAATAAAAAAGPRPFLEARTRVVRQLTMRAVRNRSRTVDESRIRRRNLAFRHSASAGSGDHHECRGDRAECGRRPHFVCRRIHRGDREHQRCRWRGERQWMDGEQQQRRGLSHLCRHVHRRQRDHRHQGAPWREADAARRFSAAARMRETRRFTSMPAMAWAATCNSPRHQRRRHGARDSRRHRRRCGRSRHQPADERRHEHRVDRRRRRSSAWARNI